jgi:hypothetical protein
MFRKLVDVLKEVFWIKPSRKKSKPVRRRAVKKFSVKKKIIKKIPKPAVLPKLKPKLPAIKQPAKSAVKTIDPSLVQVGIITHYFDRIKVCVVKLTQGTVLIGDKLTILGVKTKFVQKVWSMQIESEDVKVAKKGQLIGLKVDKLVAVGDKVYK